LHPALEIQSGHRLSGVESNSFTRGPWAAFCDSSNDSLTFILAYGTATNPKFQRVVTLWPLAGLSQCSKLFVSSCGVVTPDSLKEAIEEKPDEAGLRVEIPQTMSVGPRDTIAAKPRAVKRPSDEDRSGCDITTKRLKERPPPPLAPSRGDDRTDVSEHVSSFESVVRQGLRSKDMKLLDKLFAERDHSVVERTVSQLTVADAMELLKEVIERIHKTPGRVYQLEGWLIRLLRQNAGYFMSIPSSRQVLEPLYSHIALRLSTHSSLIRVQGRVEGMLAQAIYRSNLKATNNRLIADTCTALMEHVEGQR